MNELSSSKDLCEYQWFQTPSKWSNLTGAYFSNGLKPPTRKPKLLIFCKKIVKQFCLAWVFFTGPSPGEFSFHLGGWKAGGCLADSGIKLWVAIFQVGRDLSELIADKLNFVVDCRCCFSGKHFLTTYQPASWPPRPLNKRWQRWSGQCFSLTFGHKVDFQGRCPLVLGMVRAVKSYLCLDVPLEVRMNG